MRIAVISDIHANLVALQAVLEDIEKQQVAHIYCAGDLVGYAPFPDEVIGLVRERQIPTVMGNYDDAIGNRRLVCGCDYKDEQAAALGTASIAWTRTHTSEAGKAFLRGLPETIRFEAEGKAVLIVHGSPRRLNEYLFEDTSSQYIKELLMEAAADIMICGHTHRSYCREVDGRYLINAGSVGKPKHGNPDATYVILNLDPEVSVEIRKVPYDFETAAKEIEASGLPDELAEMLRQGSG